MVCHMKAFRPLSTTEQLAAHLRGEILRGSLHGMLPGVQELVRELGSSPNTVMGAVRLLEQEGLLENQGSGRRSRIVIPAGTHPPGLRIELLLYEKADKAMAFEIELRHGLMDAGHVATYSSKALKSLGMDVKKVARHVATIQTDAWVLLAASQAVQEWFAKLDTPAFAMFGRNAELPMAGVFLKKFPAQDELMERLIALGHRRIVLMVREERRVPKPGAQEQRFLERMEAAGIRTGAYNLPDWEETPEGLCRCLDRLFALSPPTAMIMDESALYVTARLHLAQRGIATPRDVSMICMDPDPAVAWTHPPASHVSWDASAMQRRVLEWVANVAQGKQDHRATFLTTKFHEGGTMGPAPGPRAAQM